MREGAGYSDTLFWHNISRFLWLCLSDFSGAILTDATGSNRAPYSLTLKKRCLSPKRNPFYPADKPAVSRLLRLVCEVSYQGQVIFAKPDPGIKKLLEFGRIPIMIRVSMSYKYVGDVVTVFADPLN